MPQRSACCNFSAGPAHLPDVVLEQAQAELLNWQQSGRSILEISHRSPEFEQLAAETVQQLRQLLKLPQHYEVLFMQGGGRLQFAAVPLNLWGSASHCQYLIHGHWGQLAAQEAARFGKVNSWHAWEKTPAEMQHTVDPKHWPIDSDAAFVHLTSNETIHGIQLPDVKLSKAKRVAIDMSSDILSRAIDFSHYDIIYACAQKTMGAAGITFVIVNPACLQPMDTPIPSYLSYQQQLKSNSLYNTAPTFCIYLCNLTFKWIAEQGGVAALQQRSQQRADMFYQLIEQHPELYCCRVLASLRSNMNICFYLPTAALEAKFLALAQQANIYGIKGHRIAGGIRISLYNFQAQDKIDRMLEFMQDFASHQA